MKNILVGMSGGVDSSAAANLLLQQGYTVGAVTLRLLDCLTQNHPQTEADDARAVAEKIGISHTVLNLSAEFKDAVADKFISEYQAARTPNPCIECNRCIKFGKMLDFALENGYDGIATGHYAQIEYNPESGRYLLKKAKDLTKDQTYVLYSLSQHALAHTLFPLGGYTKAEVREIAEQNGFKNARKKDSQDICFIPDGDYAGFITKQTGKTFAEGDYLDLEGNILGKHCGIIHYTIGQRKGLGITFGEPRFVTAKDAKTGTVTLGKSEDLFTDTCLVQNVNWIQIENLTAPMRVCAKTRYSQKETPATITPTAEGGVLVKFDEKVRAISPGQACVFYDGDFVVGGGTIV